MSDVLDRPATSERHGVIDPEKKPITQVSLNDDVMTLISLPGKIWWAAFLFDLTVLGVALVAVRNLIVHGWGVSGFQRPVVMAITGMPARAGSCFCWARNSHPVITVIRRSSRMRQGLLPQRSCSSASSPFATAMTW